MHGWRSSIVLLVSNITTNRDTFKKNCWICWFFCGEVSAGCQRRGLLTFSWLDQPSPTTTILYHPDVAHLWQHLLNSSSRTVPGGASVLDQRPAELKRDKSTAAWSRSPFEAWLVFFAAAPHTRSAPVCCFVCSDSADVFWLGCGSGFVSRRPQELPASLLRLASLASSGFHASFPATRTSAQ